MTQEERDNIILNLQQGQQELFKGLEMLTKRQEKSEEAICRIQKDQELLKKQQDDYIKIVSNMMSNMIELQKSTNLAIERLSKSQEKLEVKVDNLIEKVDNLGKRITKLEESIVRLEERVTMLEKRVTMLERRVTMLERRVTMLEKRVANLEKSIDGLNITVARIEVEHGEKLDILFDADQYKREKFQNQEQILQKHNEKLNKHSDEIYFLKSKVQG